MIDLFEAQLKDLETRKATLTPEEEAVRVSLLDLDEQEENKVDADKALVDAIAAETPPSVPQAVVDAQAAVTTAAQALTDSQTAVDAAELALKAVVAPATTPTV